MMDSEQQQRQHSLVGLTGLPPLPKSLSAAAGGSSSVLLHSGLPQTRSHTSSPLHPTVAGGSASVAALTAAAGDLYLGPSTSAAARNRNYNGHGQRHGSLSSTQESLSDRESVHSRASSTHSGCGGGASQQHTPTNSSGAASSTIDTQLAILRREMYGLRQLDLSLLSQLWALNESIQGFRVFLQEQDALSPPSRSRTPSDANSLSSDEDDGSYEPVGITKARATPAIMSTLASPATSVLPNKLATGSTTSHASTSSTSGTSGSSSAASSMGKHHHHLQQQQHLHLQQRPAPPPAPPAQHKAHPQLPRILQQRMRHAPPPPPPTRSKAGGASSSSSNQSISSVTQQQQLHHQRPV
ncbi:formin-3 [Scaptodrosophila lebanonensis]|uniref:Formin-3 n=1 Tax=Drosophila lebanonensis TaxID=7225 RepID=A0A6J2TXZ3_DROLE|nr:formin-3 [Scaptodrosophila lebanonensis]